MQKYLIKNVEAGHAAALVAESLLYWMRKAIPRDGQHQRHANKDNPLFQPGFYMEEKCYFEYKSGY